MQQYDQVLWNYIPLLSSKEAIKKIDLQEDKANMFVKKVEINYAVTGLYSVTLNNSLSDENAFKSNILIFIYHM